MREPGRNVILSPVADILSIVLILATLALQVAVRPVLATDPVKTDADDPAVWVNPRDAGKSVIIGTNKVAKPDGALVVFDLKGHTKQTVDGLDRPNNVDVEYGLRSGRRRMDLAVTTERKANRLRVFSISKNGTLTDVSGDTSMPPEEKPIEPMGISLYRPKTGRVFAVVSPKEGPTDGHLLYFELVWNPVTKKVDAKFIKRFGAFSGKKEIEALCVDDELDLLYASDERFGTRRYALSADPKEEFQDLGTFNTTGFKEDHEGVALWKGRGDQGYLVCTDQVNKESVFHVYERKLPNREIGTFTGGCDTTDGIEVVSGRFGKVFPEGVFIAMNSTPKNFLVFSWRDIRRGLHLPKVRNMATTAKPMTPVASQPKP